jgi:hypothetical protein
VIKATFDELVAAGQIVVREERPPPPVPMDYSWARVSQTLVSMFDDNFLGIGFDS